MRATSFWPRSLQVMKRGLHTRNQAAVNALASQWISLQKRIQADYVGLENDVHGVLGQTGSKPRWQNSMAQGYKSCPMTDVSISEVNMSKNSSILAVFVPMTLSIKLVNWVLFL